MNIEQFPLASFCIIAYKAEKYIEEAIKGAFSQNYPNLEIILSDDGSPDSTFDIMQRMTAEYKGPHKILLNQNTPNMGPRAHYCKVMYELAHGEFIILADGDDISLPSRTSVSVDMMLKHPELSSVSFYSQLINEKGDFIKSPLFKISNDNYTSIFTLTDYINNNNFYILSDDSRAFRRKVIDSFPPLKYPYAEDLYFFIRSIMVGPVAYIRQPLVLYRQHSDSIMGIERKKKNITKVDKDRFENSKKQILTDYQYALDKGIIMPEDASVVYKKINCIIRWIKPRRRFFLFRILRRFYSFIKKANCIW